MKKITLALGSLFLVAAFVLPSFGHTFYTSHDHNLAVRPHTERIAPIGYYRTLTRDYYRCGYVGCTREPRVQVPRTPQALIRDNRSDITREANTYQNRYIVVRKGNYVDRLGSSNIRRNQARYEVADTGDYQIGRLSGFQLTANGDYRSNGTTLAYRIQGVDNTNCTLDNFWKCAQSQNQAFRANQSFSFVRNVNASYRWNQTDQDSFNYFPTVTESFDTTVNGQMYTYYTFIALNTQDNTLIRIEAVSRTAEKNTASQKAYRLFQSFRFN